MARHELKARAKKQIKGNTGILFLITLIIGAVFSLRAMIPVVGSIAGVVVLSPAFSLAVVSVYPGMGQDPNLVTAPTI